jgi:ribosomal protein S21
VQEVRRKKGETFESLLRRFTKKVQASGKLLQAKKVRFYERPKSRNLKRQSALQRAEMREKIEYLKKIGRFKEETDLRSRYLK